VSRRAKAAALLLAAAALSACNPFSRSFHIKGEITLASRLLHSAPRENSVLFVVAKNLGGMPVAIKRIVNPQFPVPYELTADDLLVPGYRPTDSLRLEVEWNTHGDVGNPRKGDLFGSSPDPVSPRESDVHIVIDKQL
jgi:hypothetical protein